MPNALDRKELARLVAGEGVPVPASALEPLACYLEMLCLWNARMNLVGARSWREIWQRLVVDSFHLAAFLHGLPLPPQPRCWDLGAGAGLPGIPLRMAFERGSYVLVEARQKRALFLSSVLRRLCLPATSVFHGRVEDFFPGQPPAHCIVSRAFMPWTELLALVAPWLDPAGMVIIMALEAPPSALPGGWRLLAEQSYRADGDKRWLWAVRPAEGPSPEADAPAAPENCRAEVRT